MSEHFKAYSAVFPLILKANGSSTSILLHRRQNTGYQDGKWDIAGSGHVDAGETARMAVIRECREELGIEVPMEAIDFAHLSHRCADRTYYDVYFTISRYRGEPAIQEQDKCSELSWFDMEHLPKDIIVHHKLVIEAYRNKEYYSEMVEVPVQLQQ